MLSGRFIAAFGNPVLQLRCDKNGREQQGGCQQNNFESAQRHVFAVHEKLLSTTTLTQV